MMPDFISGLSDELLKILTDLQTDKTSFEKQDITHEEKAIYDILVKVRDEHISSNMKMENVLYLQEKSKNMLTREGWVMGLLDFFKRQILMYKIIALQDQAY